MIQASLFGNCIIIQNRSDGTTKTCKTHYNFRIVEIKYQKHKKAQVRPWSTAYTAYVSPTLLKTNSQIQGKQILGSAYFLSKAI